MGRWIPSLVLIVAGSMGCAPAEPPPGSITSGDEETAEHEPTLVPDPTASDGDTFESADGVVYRIDREVCCAAPIDTPADAAEQCRAGGYVYLPEPFCSGTPPPPHLVEEVRQEMESCHRRCACRTQAHCGPVP